jgi:subtilase family serine protease
MAALLAGCSGGNTVPPAQGGGTVAQSVREAAAPDDVQRQIALGNVIPACPDIVLGQGRCLALGLRNTALAPRSEDVGHGSVSGFGPSQLQAAYNITNAAQNNPGGLVALVEYSGDPNLESDLATYRAQFNLPACTVKSGCLTIVNQNGKTHPLPPVNSGWLAEQSLDVDMVSANCPNCKILVVEAHANLYKAEETAASFKPLAISNSWGGNEYRGENISANRYFNFPGIAITASAGDGGYGVIFPSAANTVSAIGGTSLYTAQNGRGFSETVWSGSGSGCSKYESTPSWQESTEKSLGGCTKRIVSDVSYVANPATGVAVYESIQGDGESPGWQVWGGTSVGSPAIAAIYALSGVTTGIPASIAYANPTAFYDVTSGSNGKCSPAYLCTGEVGYDGPTGLGTPDGLAGF